jgi:hypothetical protein
MTMALFWLASQDLLKEDPRYDNPELDAVSDAD